MPKSRSIAGFPIVPPLLLFLLCLTAASRAHAQDADDTAGTTLPPVVVTASRAGLEDILSPGVVSVAYPDDVKGEHKSLPDLLEQIPGVYVRHVAGTAQYTTASIRGSAPSQVNVYIDGVPFNLASETAADLSTIPISNVERVEVYRGTVPARFSGAPVGGAINIVTKTPKGLHGSVSAGARSYVGRQGGVSLTTPLGSGALLVGANTDRSKGNFKWKSFPVSTTRGLVSEHIYSLGDPYNNTDIPIERTRQSNSFKKDDLLVKWQDDNFVVKWAYTYMDRFLPWGTWGGSAINYLPHNNTTDVFHYCDSSGNCYDLPHRTKEQKQRQHDILLGWNKDIGALNVGLNLSMLDKKKAFYNYYPSSRFDGSDYSQYDTRRYGLAGDLSYALGDGWAIDQFLELHADWHRETYDTEMVPRKNSEFLDNFRRRKTTLQAQDTFTLNVLDGLQITPVGRLERLQGPTLGMDGITRGGASGNVGWKPTGSLSAKKDFGRGWQVFGNYGTYNRYPNFYEIYGDGIYIEPNVGGKGLIPLKREFSHNIDAGLGWNGHLAGEISGGFRATYFERKTKNEITLMATPIAAKYVNSGDTYTHGGELEGHLAYGRRADLQFAVTRQEGWYQNDGYYYYGGDVRPAEKHPGQTIRTLNHPTLTADVRLNLHFLDGDLTTFAELKHTGRTFTTQTDFERSLTTIDTGLHYDIGHGLRFSLGVTDLFNQGPKQSYYSPYNGIRETLGVDCSGLTGIGKLLCENYNMGGTPIVRNTPVTYNVQYPKQGRTFYSTLAWRF